MSKIEPIVRAPGSRAFSVHDARPFNLRPVCAAGRNDRSASGPYATHYTATASWLYMTRQPGSDRFGPVPDAYLAKDDLLDTGRFHPEQRMPPTLKHGPTLWIDADQAAEEGGPEEVSAIHMVASLPLNIEPDRWRKLVRRFSVDHLVSLGMIVDFAVHAKKSEDGGWTVRPHVHLLATARFWRANGRRGDRQRAWLCSKDQIRAAEDAWLALTSQQPSSIYA